ncbi:hypothetical protein [Aureispira sp. CCB-QB1]|uniref:hypothetical protein n=1 Tax=Aureispira sp. CCB-QB1 TaxID=1313421 RepID=UPI000696EC00|nr:hypothetical protein [Aureispira sp. CCB-QB1]
MKELYKKLMTWFFSCFNFGVWINKPKDLDTLLHKMEQFGLLEESYELQMVYHTLIINEAFKTVIMIISLCCLMIANVDKILNMWDRVVNKVKSLKNK